MNKPGPLNGTLGRWGDAWIPGEPWMRHTLWAILALAAVLRCWRLWDMPFMHDELSALVRLYPSFREMIVHGVGELDVHPPGVQVFMWSWAWLFGTGAFAVKLPFVLMSLLALVAVYRIGMAWSGPATALLAVVLLAVLQYGVLYGQLARPYAAGLFTTAWCADQCTRWLASGGRRHLVGICIAAVLSAYIHYFALLQAAIICVGILPFVPRPRLRPYLLTLLCAALLYLPSVPILIQQLGVGGLGSWLPVPGPGWTMEHFWWVAHTTWWLAAPLLVLLAWSLFRWRSIPLGKKTGTLVLLGWGLLPLCIGLAYSVWRAPVIQHSGLLFSFPYLILAVFIGLEGSGRKATLLIVASIAVVGTVTLVAVRQHYHTVYSSHYRIMLDTARRTLEDGPGQVAVLLDAPDEQLDHLLRHGPYDPDMPHVRLRHLAGDPGRLDSLLSTIAAHTVVYGDAGGPPEQLAGIQRVFPVVRRRIDLPEGSIHILERSTAVTPPTGTRTLALALPGGEIRGAWEIHADLPVRTDSTGTRAWDYGGREYGVLCALLLDSVTTLPQDQVEVIAEITAGRDVGNVALVVELKRGDSTLFYRTAELDRLQPFARDERHTLIVAARPEYATGGEGAVLLRAYLYDRSGAPVLLHRMELRLREGNPVLYGITGPITGTWRYRP